MRFFCIMSKALWRLTWMIYTLYHVGKTFWNLVSSNPLLLNLLHPYLLCFKSFFRCQLQSIFQNIITFRFVFENVKYIWGNGGSRMPAATRRILLKQPSRRKMLYFWKFHIDQTHTLFAVKFLHLISSYESIFWATVHKHGSEWIIERT